LQNGVCVTPPPAPGTCPAGQYPVNGVCEPTSVLCPGGTVDASGNCIPPGTPVAVGGVCPTGFQIDSAGNCTPAGSETNPYSLYLPADDEPGGNADTTAAATAVTCSTGYFADLAGACWPDTLIGWLQSSTLIAGVPNMEVVGGGVAAALGLFLIIHAMGGKDGKKASRK
jgi:hypothetical protein